MMGAPPPSLTSLPNWRSRRGPDPGGQGLRIPAGFFQAGQGTIAREIQLHEAGVGAAVLVEPRQPHRTGALGARQECLDSLGGPHNTPEG
jgi:hypothetical protein